MTTRRLREPQPTRQRVLADPHSIEHESVGPAAPVLGNRSTLQLLAAGGSMAASFRTDFSGVRIHRDSARARILGARAYTQGEEIHFAPGEYQPDSHAGRAVLGHELAHVVQQRQGRVLPRRQLLGVELNDDAALEAEADRMGEAAAAGRLAVDSQAPSPTSVTSGSRPLQRKVGFELEMAVLIDKKGMDAGYGATLGATPTFKVSSDHDNGLKRMTDAAYWRYGDTTTLEDYCSIIELITDPIDETAPDAVQTFTRTVAGLTLFAKNVAARTQGFAHRVRLGAIVPNANPDIHVGLDAHPEVPQLQSLDANIQATVGLDLAQVPALLTKFADGHQPGAQDPLLADPNDFIAVQQRNSVAIAARIMQLFKLKLRKNFQSSERLEDYRPTAENQGLANLEGLVALIVLYLQSAAMWSAISTTKPSTIGNMTAKNITPFLSHTDLATARSSLLTSEEDLELLDDGNQKLLRNAILSAKYLDPKFDRNKPMIHWGDKRFGPTPTEFVEGVLSGLDDPLTRNLLPLAKQMGPEHVGPIDPHDDTVSNNVRDVNRRMAPVIELRALANKLSTLQSKTGRATKFPPEAWGPLLSEIFFTVRRLSFAGYKKA